MKNTSKAVKGFKLLMAIALAASLTTWSVSLSAFASPDASTGEAASIAAADAGVDDAADEGQGASAASESSEALQDAKDATATANPGEGDEDPLAAELDADEADESSQTDVGEDMGGGTDENVTAGVAAAKKASTRIKPLDAGTPVCKIGSTTYESIADAIAAVPDGTPTTITMIADATMDAQVDIAEGKTITLTDDGKAHRIDATAGMFNISGDFTIAATSNSNLKLYGGDGGADFGNIATVGKSGTGHLTLSAGTLYGGTVDNPSNGAVYLEDGTFDMTGGLITECTCSTYFNAPVYVSGNGVCNMSGGEISGNTSASCAGVLVVDFDKSKTPTINLSGGKISNNIGTGGTAINAMSNARINISGGEISENEAEEKGACIVYLAGTSELTMTGGKIINNTSVYGGAVMTNSKGLCSFTAGEISGNVAEVAGGAIFATKTGTQIYVQDCLVSDNHATTMGGGLWCCPTGGADVKATHGVAIFDNTADGAGDDFASLYYDGTTKGDIHLSNYVLGDNRVEYFADGAVEPGENGDWQGSHIDAAPRYDASNPSDPVTVDGPATENQALKAVIGETGKTNARNQAKMIITNNTAAYGGGIATNGIVTAGFSDEDLDKEHEVIVSKQDGAGASVEGATLTVTSEIGDQVEEWVTDATGNHTLNLLPGTYLLTETKTPDGYKTADPITFTVDRTGAISVDGETVESVVMIDEKDEDEGEEESEEPEGGEEGEEPESEEPGEEAEDLGGASSTNSVGKTSSSASDATQTGDAGALLPMALLALAGTGGFLVIRRRRKA